MQESGNLRHEDVVDEFGTHQPWPRQIKYFGSDNSSMPKIGITVNYNYGFQFTSDIFIFIAI